MQAPGAVLVPLLYTYMRCVSHTSALCQHVRVSIFSGRVCRGWE